MTLTRMLILASFQILSLPNKGEGHLKINSAMLLKLYKIHHRNVMYSKGNTVNNTIITVQ